MARIVVVGSVSVDEIVYVADGVREGAHLEGVVRGRRLGGGAANTGVALAHAGHDVVILSAVGEDSAGDWILDQLGDTGCDASAIVRTAGPSTRSFIMIDGKGERTVVNLGRAIERAAPERLLDIPADCVYVRSRAPGIAGILRAKMSSSLMVVHVPPLGDDVRPGHVIVTSRSDIDDAVAAAPFEFGRRTAGDDLRWIVVTEGARGATAYGPDRAVFRAPPRVDPVDTTGAGDSFTAGLIHSLVRGLDIEAALATGNAWGAESTLYEASALPPTAAVFAAP